MQLLFISPNVVLKEFVTCSLLPFLDADLRPTRSKLVLSDTHIYMYMKAYLLNAHKTLFVDS